MQITQFKKKSFIIATLAGLALIVALVNPFASQALAKGEKKDGQLHGDWKINCAQNEGKSTTTCLAQQTISVKQDDKDVPVATYQFFYNDKKELKLLQLLPQGVFLQVGTNIIVGQKLIAPGKFTICQNAICIAAAEISNSDLQTITAATDVAVGFLNGDGKQVNLKLSTNGLKAALEVLK